MRAVRYVRFGALGFGLGRGGRLQMGRLSLELFLRREEGVRPWALEIEVAWV